MNVIVADSLRGNGLGRELLEAIVSHPAVADVDVLVLDCREGLVPFYERCGFERHEGFAHRPGGDEKGTDGGGSDSGGTDEEPLVTMRYVGDEAAADATGGAEPAS